LDQRKLTAITSELFILPDPLMEIRSVWISKAFKERYSNDAFNRIRTVYPEVRTPSSQCGITEHFRL
jgi:hypothetical protein